MYTVITGDVIQSRQVSDRGGLQNELVAALEQVNVQFKEYIVVAFQITMGDEFQGMLYKARTSPGLTSALREFLYPVKVRLSVGIGNVATHINPAITKMDGPAFHLARQGIEELATQKKRLTTYVTQNEDANKILCALTLLSDILLLDRTDKQWEAFKVYRLEKNLKKVADQLGVKFQNIHKRLQAAHWDELEQADKLLAEYLETVELTHYRVNNQISPKNGLV